MPTRERGALPAVVIVRKVKRQPTLGFGRHPAYELRADRYGRWLFCPKGTIYRGQTGSDVVELEVGQGTADAGLPVIHLIPGSAWWVAWWCELFISVDICAPPDVVDGELIVEDLELDVLAYPDGTVALHDEDEFAEACAAGLISPSEATRARAAADEIVMSLRDRAEPFGDVGWSRLAEAINQGLPPIRELSHVPTA